MRFIVIIAVTSVACGPTRAPLPDPDPSTPRCTSTDAQVTCTHQTTTLVAQLLQRNVHWQIPVGTAPDTGWPAVIMFQGSFHSAILTWDAKRDAEFGGYFQTQVARTLLEHGFAVLTPEAKVGGSTYWDTNIPPYSTAWTTSGDHQLMLAIFTELSAGTFGPIDSTRLFATGISSGGYMTSRMADAYPGKFRALAIQSASWESCAGPACVLPAMLPADHPPTLFLHGELDDIVPISTAHAYDDQLGKEGHEHRFVSDPMAKHEWLSVAPDEILSFFTAH